MKSPAFIKDEGSGVRDEKGREWGFRGWARELDDGRYSATVQKTRGGVLYGASQPCQVFRSREEAVTYVLDTITKRVARLWKTVERCGRTLGDGFCALPARHVGEHSPSEKGVPHG